MSSDPYHDYIRAWRQESDQAKRSLLARVFLNQLYDPELYPVDLGEVNQVIDDTLWARIMDFLTLHASLRAGAMSSAKIIVKRVRFGDDPIRHTMLLAEAERHLREVRP